MSHFSTARSRGVVVLAAAAVLAVGAGSGAVAGSLITGNDIKNGTIQSKDIENGTIVSRDVANATLKVRDLTPSLRELINEQSAKGEKGDKGDKGDKGETGPQGPKGADGTASYAGPNWSIIDRNVIGNGDSYLRSGPTVGTAVKPPMGIGSLGLRTGSATDKASFGNEVDFVGKTLASVSSVSFWEYTTGENIKISPTNLASVSFEIDPNVMSGAKDVTYSTLNYIAQPIAANQWTKIDTNTAHWWLTGDAGTVTGCNQTTYCTLAEVKSKLAAATFYTVQIGKGRDSAFTGAVDALQIGSTTYDFEPFGVIEKTS